MMERTMLFLAIAVLARAQMVHVFPPQSVDVSASTLDSLAELPSPDSLPDEERARSLDPWAQDSDRAALPVALSGIGVDFEWLNASVGELVCTTLRDVESWDPLGDGSASGFVCSPLGEGTSNEKADVSVAIRETISGEVRVLVKEEAVRFDILESPLFELVGTISSELGGGPSLSTSDMFARSVAWVGDIDGDGLAMEVVVGASEDNTGKVDGGAVFLLSVGQDGGATVLSKIASGLNGGPTLAEKNFFGISVCFLGDVDADGRYAEIAVGGEGSTQGADETGSVFLMSLEMDGTARMLQRVSNEIGGGPSLKAEDKFGVSVANVGDVDGDGNAHDLAVGAVLDDTIGSNRGCVYIFTVHTDGTVMLLVQIVSGDGVSAPNLQDSDWFGISVAALLRTQSEVDGTEIAVGAYGDDTGGSSRGAVYFLTISVEGNVNVVSKMTDGVANVPSLGNWDQFGTSVAWLDHSGSNLDTLAVGVYREDSTKGAVFIATLDADRVPVQVSVVSSGKNGGPSSLGVNDNFGVSVAFFGGPLANLLAVGAWKNDLACSDCGTLFLLEMQDLTDASTPAHIERALAVVESEQEFDGLTGGQYSPWSIGALPLLEPIRNISKSNYILPLVVLTDVYQAAQNVAILNITIGGSVCDSAVLLPDWPTTSNSRRIGVACVGIPGGVSGSVVGASVTYEDQTTNIVSVAESDSVARYDSCKMHIDSYISSSPSITSVSMSTISSVGGESILLHGSFGSLNFSSAFLPETELGHSCAHQWHDIGEGAATVDSRVNYLALTAFIGARPCLQTTWLDESTVRCITPPGAGSNLDVILALNGRAYVLPSSISFDGSFSPTTEVAPAMIDFRGGTNISVSAPIVSVLSHSPELTQGLIITDLSLDDVLSAALPSPVPASAAGTHVEDIVAPAGYGANRRVSLCLEDDHGLDTDFYASVVEQVTLPSASRGCTSLTNASTVDFTPPEVFSVTPSVDLDPLGGTELRIIGEGFGDPTTLAAEGVEVKIFLGDSKECLSVVHVSSTVLRCVTPTISGSSLPVRVSLHGAVSSELGPAISVLTVSLVAISPRRVLPAAPGVRKMDFSVTVFGAEEVTSVVIGGVECPSIQVLADDSVGCYDLPIPSEWETDDSWLFVRGSNDSISRRAVLRAEPPPRVLAVTAPDGALPTSGGVSLSIVGEGFGLHSSDLYAVVLGGDNDVAELIRDGNISVASHVASSMKDAVVLFQSSGDANLTSSSGTSINVFLPPGSGANVPARVITTWGLISDPVFFNYDEPAISSVLVDDGNSSSSVFYPGMTSVTVEICGANLAPRSEDIDTVILGGISCESTEAVSFSCLKCIDFSSPLSSAQPTLASWPSTTVQVTVRGQSSGDVLGQATFVPPPSLEQVVPSVAKSGDTVELTGSGFGPNAAYIVGAVVGGSEALALQVASGAVVSAEVATTNDSILVSSIEYRSSSRLAVELPPGIGVDIPIRFVTATGLVSSPVFVDYELPTILSISPSVLLPGSEDLEVEVCGSNFPTRIQDVGGLWIGGIECNTLRLAAGGCIRCQSFSTPRSPASSFSEWPETGEQLVAANTRVVATLGRYLNPPSVDTVVPSAAGPGDTIVLSGTGFGASSDDVVDVAVGGSSCASFQWVSSSQLSCVVADPHPMWETASDDVIIPFLAVSVTLRTGWDGSDGSGHLVPLGGIRVRPNPSTSPVAVAAWRPVGQVVSAEVRWRYPGSALEMALLEERNVSMVLAAPVTRFRVQVAELGLFNSSVSSNVEFDRETSLVRSATSGLSETNDEQAWEWHQVRIPVFSSRPVGIRVRGENGDGPTVWVSAIDPDARQGMRVGYGEPLVAASCLPDEYLATDQDLSNVVCSDCPVGAVCGGLAAANVTGRQGYWRVPWSVHQLGFAQCPVQGACKGHSGRLTPSSANMSTVEPTSRYVGNQTLERYWAATDSSDRPVSIQFLSLQPSTYEECSRGHRGVMCSACDLDFYPGVGGACTECGSKGWIAARFLLVGALILCIVGFVFFRAWRSRLRASSDKIQILKILVTHLQTIAIVGSVQVSWPETTRSFFDVIDAGSSFTTSGLSLECLMGHVAKSPFLRTILFIVMPLSLFLFAMVYWPIFQYAELRSNWCRSCAEGVPMPETDTVAPQSPQRTSSEGGFPTSPRASDTPPAAPDSPSSSGAGAFLGTITPRSSSVFLPPPSPRRINTGPSTFSNVSSEDETPAAPRSFWEEWRVRMSLSAVVLAFLVHTPLTTAAFRLLTCVPVHAVGEPDNSKLRLVMDMDIDCEDPQSLAYILAISAPILLLVSLGLPCAAAFGLRYLGVERLSKTFWKERLGFLYNGYQAKRYYWEAIVLLRKVFLAFTTTSLAPAGGGMQIAVGLLVVLFAMSLHGRFHPYHSKIINLLEGTALVTSAVTLVGGIFIVLENLDGAGTLEGSVAPIASVVIIVVNLCFITLAAILFSTRLRKTLSHYFHHLFSCLSSSSPSSKPPSNTSREPKPSPPPQTDSNGSATEIHITASASASSPQSSDENAPTWDFEIGNPMRE